MRKGVNTFYVTVYQLKLDFISQKLEDFACNGFR